MRAGGETSKGRMLDRSPLEKKTKACGNSKLNEFKETQT